MNFDFAKGTSLMAMFHNDKVILGRDSLIFIGGKIVPIHESLPTEAYVCEKIVKDACFVGMTAGKGPVTKVLVGLQNELSQIRGDQTISMSTIAPRVEQLYDNLIQTNNEATPSRLIITTLDQSNSNLDVCLFGANKGVTKCTKRDIGRGERFICVGAGRKAAAKILHEGYDLRKSTFDMIDLMYEAMNAIHAKDKTMGGEFFADVVSIQKVGAVSRLKIEALEPRTIIGLKRKRETRMDLKLMNLLSRASAES